MNGRVPLARPSVPASAAALHVKAAPQATQRQLFAREASPQTALRPLTPAASDGRLHVTETIKCRLVRML
jgi:hypothetical protein